MSKIVMRHTDVGMKLGEWSRELSSGLDLVQRKSASFKNKVSHLDKDHGKQLKKMRSVMKKRSASLVKLDKKIKAKKIVSNEHEQKKECEVGELLLQCKQFEDEEREAVKKLAGQERQLFSAFLIGMQPVLMVEMAIFQETHKIDEASKEVENIIGKDKPEFETSDGKVTILKQLPVKEDVCEEVEAVAPRRTGSMQSLNSFCGSRLSCTIMMDSSGSFKEDCSEPRLMKRSSSLSNGSHDSGIDPCHLSLTEDPQLTFVPIEKTQNTRFSTIRRSPSPFRSHRTSLTDSPSSRGRLACKPPLPRRLPVPASSPSIQNIPLRPSETPNSFSQYEDLLTHTVENEAVTSIDDEPSNSDEGEDILNSPTEEDQEVLFYMSGEKVRRMKECSSILILTFVFSLDQMNGRWKVVAHMAQHRRRSHLTSGTFHLLQISCSVIHLNTQ